ncbi:type VII secretion system-associated protein [Saccharopolyspora gloriosae]|uniref:type VII secretion system-associated protein n=1 Tax=Saccharopolyspora gloriosae TaxID=455344 RepID=UPI001FB72D6B|nr:type VII secretion system-associated protein [Saccharopolyspora gloriosae]
MSEDETPATSPAADDESADQWVVLIDPEWEPEHEQQPPPESAIVGSWFFDTDGLLRDFRPNHAYQPSSPDSPTDPVDATLRLVMRGELPVPEMLAALPESHLVIGLDEQHAPIVTRAPDGYPSVLVLTAPAHAQRLTVPEWADITAEELADALPAEGVDVLLNPGAPASTRIGAQEFRDAVRPPVDEAPEPGESTQPDEQPPATEWSATSDPATDPMAGGRVAESADFDTPLPQPPTYTNPA